MRLAAALENASDNAAYTHNTALAHAAASAATPGLPFVVLPAP